MITLNIDIIPVGEDYRRLTKFMNAERMPFEQQPVLLQAGCSKLRELLVQRLNRLEEAHLVCDSILSCTDIGYEKREVNNVIKLIDGLPPVA